MSVYMNLEFRSIIFNGILIFCFHDATPARVLIIFLLFLTIKLMISFDKQRLLIITFNIYPKSNSLYIPTIHTIFYNLQFCGW